MTLRGRVWTEARSNAGPDAERLKASLSLAPSEGGRREASGAGPGFSDCIAVGGRGRGVAGSLPSALLQSPWEERAEPTPSRLCSRTLGPLPDSLELGSPSCRLPLQSISGSCMWVTQQHCSQAQEAAAELKGSRRSSALHAALSGKPTGLKLDCLPLCTLGDSRIFK